jgi:hypothetical protein
MLNYEGERGVMRKKTCPPLCLAMTDYYPLLAQAVATFDTADVTARRELYERAGDILVKALRRQNPEISAASISREEAALQSAILKLEAELEQTAFEQNSGHGSSDVMTSAPKLEDQLAGMPKRLAALLFGIAYLTAIAGLTGVIYLRGLWLVEASVMPYPVLVGVMTIVLCLLVLGSRPIFRKLRLYGRLRRTRV